MPLITWPWPVPISARVSVRRAPAVTDKQRGGGSVRARARAGPVRSTPSIAGAIYQYYYRYMCQKQICKL